MDLVNQVVLVDMYMNWNPDACSWTGELLSIERKTTVTLGTPHISLCHIIL